MRPGHELLWRHAHVASRAEFTNQTKVANFVRLLTQVYAISLMQEGN